MESETSARNTETSTDLVIFHILLVPENIGNVPSQVGLAADHWPSGPQAAAAEPLSDRPSGQWKVQVVP